MDPWNTVAARTITAGEFQVHGQTYLKKSGKEHSKTYQMSTSDLHTHVLTHSYVQNAWA